MAFSDDPLFGRLVDAAVLDHAAADRLLREHPSLIHGTNRLGETALHFLAIEDHADGVAFLARHGAAVDARNDSHRTPLMEAAMVGATEVVRQLLSVGADPHAETPDGDTVWDLFSSDRASELHAILREHGFTPPERSA